MIPIISVNRLERDKVEKKGGSTLDQIGAIWVEEIGEDGLVSIKEVPSYVCGHCNTVIAMRPERTRERSKCTRCSSLICEKTELCREECSPIHALAKDHFEGVERYAPFALAAMSGAATRAEAWAWNAHDDKMSRWGRPQKAKGVK